MPLGRPCVMRTLKKAAPGGPGQKEDPMNESIKSTIQTLTDQVVKQHEVHLGALAGQHQAEAELLEDVIRLAVPALDALESKLVVKRITDDWDKTRSSFSFHNEKGLFLAGDSEPHPVGGGKVDGTGLYLVSTSGGEPELRLFKYDGYIDRDTSGWTATVTSTTYETAVVLFRVEECVRHLVEALQAQLSGRKTKVVAKAERAKMILEATAILLRQATV